MENLKNSINQKPFLVVLVGRTNVGKSTIFNRILGKNLAVVGSTPYITRDALEKSVEYEGKLFSLIDTGGLFSEDFFAELVQKKAMETLLKADLILFILDAKDGVTPLDENIHQILRKTGKPVIGVVNKIDVVSRFVKEDFYTLGLDKIFFISAEHKIGIEDLLKEIVSIISVKRVIKKKERVKISILGRPNVGKSSLFNYILKQNKSLVSPYPGTTRDAIEGEKSNFIFIDTAGFRKKFISDIDYYSFIRTTRSLKWADCSILMMDAREPLTKIDRKIFSLIEKQGKGAVLALNKADLISKKIRKDIIRESLIKFPKIKDFSLIFTSCKTGEGISTLIKLLIEINEKQKRKFSKKALQEFIESVFKKNPPCTFVFRFFQKGTFPQRFTIETKRPLSLEYKNYIINQLKEYFGLLGAPVFIENKIVKK